jgi:hypothetical protein
MKVFVDISTKTVTRMKGIKKLRNEKPSVGKPSSRDTTIIQKPEVEKQAISEDFEQDDEGNFVLKCPMHLFQ